MCFVLWPAFGGALVEDKPCKLPELFENSNYLGFENLLLISDNWFLPDNNKATNSLFKVKHWKLIPTMKSKNEQRVN